MDGWIDGSMGRQIDTTGRQTDRETDREGDRERDRDVEGETVR